MAAQGLGLAAVGPDAPEITVGFAARKGITFPLLNDVGSQVIRRFGILNTSITPDNKRYGIPYPGTFVLDRQGRVTTRMFEESYRTRMTAGTLALQLGAQVEPLAGPAVHLSSPHVDLRLSTSDSTLAPGQEFSLVLEVQAKPGIHVYAPGDHAYQVIRLQLAPESGFSTRSAVYPEPRMLYFEPLDEHVPVLEGSFRILQPVVLEASRELAIQAQEPDARVTLQGSIELQACDERICFLPESLPFTLSLHLRPFESR